MKYKLSAACSCNIGRRRSNNEDNFYFNGTILPEENNGLEKTILHTNILDEAQYFAVFDGMGGQADGQIASHLAAETFKNEVETDTTTIVAPEKAMYKITQKMTDTVWECADETFSNMGTTAAMIYLKEQDYTVANVGDSRIFQFRDGLLKQISVDHTDEMFLKSNNIKKQKPALTQYIGIDPEELTVEPYIASSKILLKDQYLICSDGLTDMVDEVHISEILSSTRSVREKVEILIRNALANGGRDNITIILIQIQENTVDSEIVLQELTEALDADNDTTISVTSEHTNTPPSPAPVRNVSKGNVSKEKGISNMRNSHKRKINIFLWLFLFLMVLIGLPAFFKARSKTIVPTDEAIIENISNHNYIKEESEDGNYYYINYEEYSGHKVQFQYDSDTDELYVITVYNPKGDLVGSMDLTDLEIE